MSGLNVESINIDDGDFYELLGSEIMLGAGGFTASPSSGSSGEAGDFLILPITLSAPQTWNISDRVGAAVGENGVALLGGVQGASEPLAVNISNEASLYMEGHQEVGPLTISGTNASVAGVFNGFAAMFASDLNSTDGNPVTLEHIFFIGSGSVGPLTSSAAEIYVGSGTYPAEGLETADATFGGGSILEFVIHGAGTVADRDYPQLVSRGVANLGGVALKVRVGSQCPELTIGQSYTFVTATGGLSGTFSNAPEEGAEVPIKLAKSCSQPPREMRISYQRAGATQAVVGTVVAGLSSATTLALEPGNAMTNQKVTLTATVTASQGVPSGSVEFRRDATTVPGCANVPVAWSGASYTAACQTSFAASESPVQLSASFVPASGVDLKPSTSSIDQLNIGRDPTTVGLHASSSTLGANSSVVYTATVGAQDTGPSVPSGNVEFLTAGVPIAACANQPLVRGMAFCEVSYSAAGTYSVLARYVGDGNFSGSSSVEAFVTVQSSFAPQIATNTTSQPQTLSTIVLASGNVTVDRNGVASVDVACKGATSCDGKLTLTVRKVVKGKHRKRKIRTVTIGTADYSITAGATAVVTLHLDDAGRALLKATHGHLSAALTIAPAQSEQTRKTVHLIQKSSSGRKRRKK